MTYDQATYLIIGIIIGIVLAIIAYALGALVARFTPDINEPDTDYINKRD